MIDPFLRPSGPIFGLWTPCGLPVLASGCSPNVNWVKHVIWPLDPCVCFWFCRKCIFFWAPIVGLYFASGCGPSNSHARVACSEMYCCLHLSMVSLCMKTRSPENVHSPKLVEMISIKLLSLVWCLFWHCSLPELTVNFST